MDSFTYTEMIMLKGKGQGLNIEGITGLNKAILNFLKNINGKRNQLENVEHV